MDYIVVKTPTGWAITLDGAKPLTGERWASSAGAVKTARLLAGWRGSVTVDRSEPKAKSPAWTVEAILQGWADGVWKVKRDGVLVAHVERLPAAPGETHPFKVWAPAASKHGFASYLGATYKAKTPIAAAQEFLKVPA